MEYITKSFLTLALCLIACAGLAETTFKVQSSADSSHQIVLNSDEVSTEYVLDNVPLLISSEDDFYLELLDHESTDLQAYGVLYWAGGHKFNNRDKTIQNKVNQAIKHMLSKDSLSAQILFFLQSVCDVRSVIPACDADLVISKQLKNYPDDISVYLVPLENAVNNDIEGEVIDLVRQMANAKYLGLYLQYSEAFEKSFEAFRAENPLSNSVIDRHVTDYLESVHKRDELSKEEVMAIKKNMPAYVFHILKMSIDMSYPLPPFRALILACSTYQELKDSCLTISETMFETSKQSIGKMIGLSIPVKVHELLGNLEKAEQASLRKTKFKDLYFCLNKGHFFPKILDNSYLLLDEVLSVRVQQGDWAADQHKAKLYYQKALGKGHENAEELNPELCFSD